MAAKKPKKLKRPRDFIQFILDAEVKQQQQLREDFVNSDNLGVFFQKNRYSIDPRDLGDIKKARDDLRRFKLTNDGRYPDDCPDKGY